LADRKGARPDFDRGRKKKIDRRAEIEQEPLQKVQKAPVRKKNFCSGTRMRIVSTQEEGERGIASSN